MADDNTEPNEDEGNCGSGHDTAVERTRDGASTDRLDEWFDVLRSSQRRYLLYYLYDLDDPVTTYDDATAAVANYEAAGTDADATPTREAIRRALHHVHLPRLETAGVLECDPRQGSIRFHGDAELGVWVRATREAELD